MLDHLRARGVDITRILNDTIRAHRFHSQRLHRCGPHVFDLQRRESRTATECLAICSASRRPLKLVISTWPMPSTWRMRRLHSKQLLTAGTALSLDVGWHPEWFADAQRTRCARDG